ncbi:MAG: rRNA maturation RNase YbeY [Chitinispirillia bacterium]|jgi:probable rRNA maturation factor
MKNDAISHVNLIHDYRTLPCPRKKLRNTVKKLFQHSKGISQKYLNVIFCSDYKIKKLNKKYRKIDRPTDVLSFTFNEQDFMGEIYISLQRAKIQASRYNIEYSEEINRLFVHGFFHLMGFDHATEKDRIIMESYEKRYY